MELKNFIGQLATEEVGIFSAIVLPNGKGYHFKIVLDGLKERHGSVGIADCEAFSHRFTNWLDQQLLKGDRGADSRQHGNQYGNSEGNELLPAGLTPDNYTLEVASPGVERELSLPEELDRFKGLPLKLRYRREEQIEEALVVFEGRQAEDGRLRFGSYQIEGRASRGRRLAGHNRARWQNKTDSKRTGGDDKEQLPLLLQEDALERANLFFDV